MTDISPIFPTSVPFFLVLPFVFLLMSFLLATIVSVLQVAKG
ncbi:hypothetical protein HanXRQr2_Chr13g0598241 [Helianthus annuus]|uniref:Uncharacterized protein n=1 Tax=Helianthus annuus TaxID=4232 RepID=A0A9K3ELP2_HELAN|nr:hypothetical protein HanXRQr2_Chr13g0598241 [Helianthus annuus]KAJ0850070.1 hypothetical protein HanPSC8_Chr13g0576311 [Helianthus annuus]